MSQLGGHSPYLRVPRRGPQKPTPENGNRNRPALSTPQIKKESTQQDGLEKKDAKHRNLRYAQEARKFMLGPMPVREFIREFLPHNTKMSGMPSSVEAFDNVPTNPTLEEDIYEPLIRAINGGDDDSGGHDGRGVKKNTMTTTTGKKQGKQRMRPSRCPGFVFRDTSTRGENNELGSMKPDVCCYDETTAHLAVASNKKPCAHMGYAELFIEVKKTVAHDFFKDPPRNADRSKYQFMLDISNKKDCERATEALGQNVAYAAEACARQHRMFYLSMSLAGTSLRFIRWDRAGAIVSESFDIRTQPELLCEFLWRFAHASATERGFDPTVEFPEEGDEDRFRKAISARVEIETGFTGKKLRDAIDEHYQPRVVTVINVEDDSGKHSEPLLVSRPVASPLSVAGRATRGYWAVTASNDVVFLKDTWRYSMIDAEGANIDDMEQAGVVNIPQILIHGDVPMELRDEVPGNAPMVGTSEPHGKIVAKPRIIQHTRTQEFKACSWVCHGGQAISVTGHTHYRLVSKTVGYPLKRFVDAKELLTTTFHAYQALTSAYEKNRRLHRDISVGNVILVRETARKERRGVLIDWEFSTVINNNGHARDYERTGTWNFMSGRLLEARAQHIIQDDMESMLWVVLYCGYLWLPVKALKGRTLDDTVYDLFEFSVYNAETNVAIGGDAKRTNPKTREYTNRFEFKCAPFQEFCETMMDYHCPRDHVKVELDGQWEDPRYFGKFWSDFLDTNEDKFVGTSAEKHDNKVTNAPRNRADNPFSATLRSARETSANPLSNVEPAPPVPSPRTSKRKTDGAAAARRSTSIRGSRDVRETPVQTRSMTRLRVAGPPAGVAHNAVRNGSVAGELSNGRGSNGGVGGTRRSARLRSTQSIQKEAWRP